MNIKNTILSKKRVPRGYWQTKGNVLASAKEYTSVSEWAKYVSGALTSARKNGWYDQATRHMYKTTKPQGYWKIKENVIKSAKECQTITEWGNRYRGALYSAKENDWFDEAISHMKATIRPNGYWNNKERVLLSAKKFDAITAWTKAHGQAVKQAKANHWFKEATSHMAETGNTHNRAIYCFMSNHHVYVGLSYNVNIRWAAHRKNNQHYKWLTTIYGEESIQFFKLTDYIDLERAKAKEDHFINYFKKRGFNVLNKAIAGASGGNILKWDKDAVLHSANQCQTLQDWVKKYSTAATSARKNGWFDEATSHMVSSRVKLGYWKIKENVIKSAKEFKTLSEWSQEYSSAVTQARKNDWFDEATSHMTKKKAPIGHWKIKENVIDSATKYENSSDWAINEGAAYNSARKNGWFDEVTSHMQNKIKALTKWQIKDNVIDSAKKFQSVSEWHKHASGAVASSRKNGWHEEATSHMVTDKVNPGFWQIKFNVVKSAIKYASLVEWEKKHQAAVSSARKNGWFDEASAHMKKSKPNGYWKIKANILDSAKSFNNVKDWSRKYSAAAKSARKNMWMEEVKSVIKNNLDG